MKKYKFKVGDNVFGIGVKRIYLEGSKHRQKVSGTVVQRIYDEVNQTNWYTIETPTGMKFYTEKALTKQREKILFYLLVKDVNVYDKLEEKPEVIPEGSKLLTVMGVLDD